MTTKKKVSTTRKRKTAATPAAPKKTALEVAITPVHPQPVTATVTTQGNHITATVDVDLMELVNYGIRTVFSLLR